MCNILYGCYTNGRSHIGSRLEIICRMPVQMEAKSRVLSVTDIQGKWREKSSRSVWKVAIAVYLTQGGVRGRVKAGQTLEGLFSAVSTPIFCR